MKLQNEILCMSFLLFLIVLRSSIPTHIQHKSCAKTKKEKKGEVIVYTVTFNIMNNNNRINISHYHSNNSPLPMELFTTEGVES